MTGKTHTAIGIAAALTMAIDKPPRGGFSFNLGSSTRFLGA